MCGSLAAVGQSPCDSVQSASSHRFLNRDWEGETYREMLESRFTRDFADYPAPAESYRLETLIASELEVTAVSLGSGRMVSIEFDSLSVDWKDQFVYSDAADTSSTIKELTALNGVLPDVSRYKVIKSVHIDSLEVDIEYFSDLLNVNTRDAFFAYKPPAIYISSKGLTYIYLTSDPYLPRSENHKYLDRLGYVSRIVLSPSGELLSKYTLSGDELLLFGFPYCIPGIR